MTARIGSISSGTMKTEDLLPMFIDALSDLNEARSLDWKSHFENEIEATTAFTMLDALLCEIEQRIKNDPDYEDSEDAENDLDDLFHEMDAFAPPYCYFGSNEGDGSDYGFWVCWDAVEEDARNGDILKVIDLSHVPEGHTGVVLHTNDHGNCTLYRAQDGFLTELWSLV